MWECGERQTDRQTDTQANTQMAVTNIHFASAASHTALETIFFLLFYAYISLLSYYNSYVNAAYCYRPSSVVCRSVCLFVTLESPAKTAEPIEMSFGLWARMRPRNPVLDGSPQVLRDVAMATNFGTKIAITGFV